MLRRLLFCALATSTLAACTWVKMEPEGARIRVASRSDDLSGCSKRGEVGVSVKDQVGLYRRNELKVRDELETMARNEAAMLEADTVQALNEPSAGAQRFAAFTCGRAAPIARRDPAPREAPPAGDAQTFPVRED
jgi:hypothetical protein